MMHGQLAAKLVEEVYKSEHEKLIHMLKMVELHVLAYLLSNKTAVQTHVPQVVLLLYFIQGNFAKRINLSPA